MRRPWNPGAGDGASEQTSPVGLSPRRRSGSIRFFLACWVLLSMAGAAWTFAVPLFASPDEPAHVAHAVAVVRGELTGETVERPGQFFSVLEAVEIPAYYGTAESTAQCYALDLNKSASCSPGFRADDRGDGEVLSWVARYPPAYYAVVGLPSLVLDGAPAVYAMRLTSAVICAGLLAVGMVALRSTRLPRPALAAGILAVTPSALFLAGVVNSSGMEIAAGFATWAILLPLVLDPAAHDVPRRLWAGALVGAVLVNARPASGLMAVLIGVTLLLLMTRRTWAELTDRRAWVPAGAVCGVAGTVALAWIIVVDPTGSLGGLPAPELAHPLAAAIATLRLTRIYVEQQVGVFLDTPAPFLTFTIWAALIGAVVVVALALASKRGRIALVVGMLLVVLVPVVSQVPSAPSVGIIWQGRYLLPFSVGLPLVAYGLVLGQRSGRRLGEELAPVVIVLAAIGQVAALVWVLWRYGYGLDKLFLVDDAEWVPPTGLAVPVLLVVVAVGGLAALTLRAGGGRDPLSVEAPASLRGSRLEPAVVRAGGAAGG